jgi:hypothetical protein
MNIAIVKRGLCVAVLLGSFAPIACSSDTGGNGGGGAGGKSSNNQGAGGAPAGSVPCGNKFCSAPEGTTVMPCCRSILDSTCGAINPLTMGCGAPPPPVPKECPPLPSIGGFFQLMACCTTGGECGVDWSMLSMGCKNYADSQAQLAMFMQMAGRFGRDGGVPGFGGMGGGFGGINLNITLPAEAACTAPAAQ